MSQTKASLGLHAAACWKVKHLWRSLLVKCKEGADSGATKDPLRGVDTSGCRAKIATT